MRTPNKIIWIAAGNQENESLVSLFSSLVKQVPWNCTNLLITNAANWRTFSGETYKVTVDKEEDHSLVARYRQVVLAAYHENVLEDADIIVTGGMTAVMLIYMLTHGNEIAKVMVDEKDELVSFLVVRDKACAVIRIPFKNGKAARERSTHIKELIKKAVKEAGVE